MSRIFVIAALLAGLAAPRRWPTTTRSSRPRRAAQRKAEAAAAAKRKADADRQRSAAEAKMMRGHLGKEAEGKSDAEVRKIYDAKINASARHGEEGAVR